MMKGINLKYILLSILVIIQHRNYKLFMIKFLSFDFFYRIAVIGKDKGMYILRSKK